LVEGGTFYFGPLLSYAATVTNYCLDRYEVSVGRFRTFLNAYDQWQPTPGAGEHLPGAGTGWQPEWTKGNELPLDAAAFIDNVMSCDYATFSVTPNADASETLPQNCLTWHEAQAFCIWDGGRLATEAEWEYAAGGGEEERTYPWGDEPPDSANAVFDCCGDGDCETCSVADILPVGNKAAGEGRFGQADLAGNLYEWVLDGYAMIDFRPYPCVDCAVVPNGTTQVQRGGGYAGDGLSLQVVARPTGPATTRSDALGARCVRKR
jgi:formylglycine-generating enzyme required for sulfatase activity